MPNQLLVGLAILLNCNYMEHKPTKLGNYSGDRFGLTDSSGRELIPAQYSSLNSVGNGFFLCQGIDPTDRFCTSPKHYLFNHNGKELTPPLPEGAHLMRVLWLGEKSEKTPDETFDTLPDDAILVFQKDSKNGLCDPKGKVIAEPIYDQVSEGAEGLALLYQRATDKRARTFLMDLSSKQIKDLKLTVANVPYTKFSEGLAKCETTSGAFGYINTQGKYQIPPRFYGAGNFINGTACVVQSFGTSIIDKSGAVISPKNMNVEGFRGDYAIACKRMNKESPKGLVNRKFEYVLEPQYIWIRPLSEVNSRLETYDSLRESPKLYIATDKNAKRTALSPDGKPLFDFPDAQSIPGLQYNLIQCLGVKIDPKDPKKLRSLFVNLDGKPADEEATKSWLIAQDRMVKRVPADDDTFDSVYWNERRVKPIPRRKMFENFVHHNNLIGMQREEVISFLGKGESSDPISQKKAPHLIYMITPAGCVLNRYVYAKVFYNSDNKVTGWCYSQDHQDRPLVTTNDFKRSKPSTIDPYDDW